MHNLNLSRIEICSADDYLGYRDAPELPTFDCSLLTLHQADAHWIVVDDHQFVRARCSLWWRSTPHFDGRQTGVIGHFAATDDRSAATLLDRACHELAARGSAIAIGPMNQNTWRDYRCVIDDFAMDKTNDPAEASFLMEPQTANGAATQFVQSGFQAIASYFSSLVNDLSTRCPRLDVVRRRVSQQGIGIRSLNLDSWESEMRQIHRVVRTAFADHLLYVEVSESDFLEMYRPLRQAVNQNLVLVAEHQRKIVGFCFAIPDSLQARRSDQVDTVVLKTLGVIPQWSYAGLGQVLLEEAHRRASSDGYRRCIHALVRQTPSLQRIADRYGTPFRSYALFGKELP